MLMMENTIKMDDELGVPGVPPLIETSNVGLSIWYCLCQGGASWATPR